MLLFYFCDLSFDLLSDVGVSLYLPSPPFRLP